MNHQPFVRPGSGDPSAPKDECIPASAILPYPLDNGVELADFIELLPVRGALARVEEARGRCKKVHDFGTLSRSAFVFGMFEPVLGSIPGSGTAWNPREPKVNLVLDEMSEMVEKGIMLAWELTSDTWSVGDANQRTRQQAAVAKLSAAAAWQELKYEHSPEVIFESKRVKAAAAAAAEARRMEEEAAMEAGEVEEAREIGEAEELGEMEETRETEEAEAVTDAEGVDQSAVGVAGIGLSGGARVGAGSVAREPGNESWLAEQRARSRTLSSVLEEE